MTKFGPKLAFLVNLDQAVQVLLVPCWLVGWWLWRGLYLARHLFTLFIYSSPRPPPARAPPASPLSFHATGAWIGTCAPTTRQRTAGTTFFLFVALFGFFFIFRNDILVTGVNRIGPSIRSGPAFCPRLSNGTEILNGNEILVSSGQRKSISVKVDHIAQFIIQSRL